MVSTNLESTIDVKINVVLYCAILQRYTYACAELRIRFYLTVCIVKYSTICVEHRPANASIRMPQPLCHSSSGFKY